MQSRFILMQLFMTNKVFVCVNVPFYYKRDRNIFVGLGFFGLLRN